jgi:uncharacterized protein YcnI
MSVLTRLVLAALAASALLAPAAGAHVTLNPREVEPGSFARLDVRVPSERPDAATTSVSLRLPDGLFFVSFQPKPGWERTVETERLDEPVEVSGQDVQERIASVTWSGGRIRPGEFEEFGLTARIPEEEGGELTFPAVQRYAGGETVRWIGPEDADEPAPRVSVGAAATTEPAAAPTATPAARSDDGGGVSGGLALGVAIAGLVVALAALTLAISGRASRARSS